MKKLILASFLFAFSGCTDAQMGQVGALGSQFKVTLYSGGQPVKTWISTGKVSTETHSDGWYFIDSVSHRLIRVSGPVVVEQL